MEEYHDLHLRFHMNRENQRKAWEILSAMDRNLFASYVDMISSALIAADNHEQITMHVADQGQSDRIVQEYAERIAMAAENIMKYTIPSFLTGSQLAGAKAVSHEAIAADSDKAIGETVTSNTIPDEEIDWDFLGEG